MIDILSIILLSPPFDLAGAGPVPGGVSGNVAYALVYVPGPGIENRIAAVSVPGGETRATAYVSAAEQLTIKVTS